MAHVVIVALASAAFSAVAAITYGGSEVPSSPCQGQKPTSCYNLRQVHGLLRNHQIGVQATFTDGDAGCISESLVGFLLSFPVRQEKRSVSLSFAGWKSSRTKLRRLAESIKLYCTQKTTNATSDCRQPF